MKNLFFLFFLSILLASCGSSSKLTNSLKFPLDEVKTYENLAVIAFFQNMNNRANVEQAMETEFRTRGVKANSTFNLFPLAGNKEIFATMGLGPEEIKDLVRRKVTENNIDAFMTISLLDANQEERYVGGTSVTFGGPAYRGDYPIYDYGFYDYYAYAYRTSYSTGYYKSSTTYFLELNLYDIETEDLLWTGQTTTKDPDNIRKESVNYAKMVVDEIMRLNIVKP